MGAVRVAGAGRAVRLCVRGRAACGSGAWKLRSALMSLTLVALSTRDALCGAGAERAGGMARLGELGEARAGEVLTVLGRCLSSREAHGGQVLRLLSCAS